MEKKIESDDLFAKSTFENQKDGIYKATLKYKSDSKNAREESLEYDIILDTKKPIIEKLDVKGDIITVDAKDTLSGIKYIKAIDKKYNINHVIGIEDMNIRAEINRQLGRKFNAQIFKSDLMKITSLGSEKMPLVFVKSIKGLEESNIKELYLKESRIKDFREFSKLPSLEKLYIKDDAGVSLNDISSLDNIKNLSLINCNFENIKVLSNMKKIEKLDVSENKISDFDGFENVDVVAKNQIGKVIVTSTNQKLPVKFKDEVEYKIEGLSSDYTDSDISVIDGEINVSKDGKIYKILEEESESFESTGKLPSIKISWKNGDGKVCGILEIVLDSSITLNSDLALDFGSDIDFGDDFEL